MDQKPKKKKAKTWADLAEHFGIARDHIRQYWTTKGMPGKDESGYWDIEAIEAWRQITFSKDNESSTSGEFSEQVARAKAEKIIADSEKSRADAELRKLELRKNSENLVPLELVENFLSELFTSTRRTFARIGMEMKDGYPKELQARIKEDCDRRIELALRSMEGDIERLVEVRDHE